MVLPAQARRAHIAQLVNAESWISVTDLAGHFGVSDVSIRRDLKELERAGFLQRVRGGALRVASAPQDDVYSQRAARRMEQKRRIARAAIALIQPSDSIILDSGSTVAEVARHIATEVSLGQHLRIITGSIPVVEAFTPHPETQVLFLGGLYLHQYRTVIGPQTLASLEGLHADKMFMGSDGLTMETGTTTANVLEAEVTRSLTRAADKVIVVADSSKIGQTGFTTVMPLQQVDILVTDSDAPSDVIAELREMGMDIRLA